MKSLNEGKNLKIFKNKFFIIALSLAIFSVVLTSTLSVMGRADVIRDAVNIVATPFRYIGIKISEAVDGFSKYFENMEALYKENRELKIEIERLEGELAAEKGAKEENERLRSYLNIANTYPDLKFLDALIIGGSGEEHITFLTLNRGSGDGVKLGMPIINEVGLVGSVCEVGYNWCRVRILSEASSGVGAYVKRSGDIGIVSGVIPNENGKTCYLEYLDDDSDIEVGDLVYTSGKGSTYPRDLYIGKITEVKVDKYLRTKVAKVECAVNFDELKYVMIVTDYEILREGTSE